MSSIDYFDEIIDNNNNKNNKNNNNNNNKNNKNKLIGQGSYGCIWKPGINCNGKVNKNKNYINKIQAVNFYSKNELEISNIIKKIYKYQKFFVTVQKYCIVKFNKLQKSDLNLRECEVINHDIYNSIYRDYYNVNKSNKDITLLDSKYYLFYIKYIHGYSIPDLFAMIDKNKSIYFHNLYYTYISVFYKLLNGIYLLNKNNIIHNDLHMSNIRYSIKKKSPLILDYGLSYNIKKIFKFNNAIDYKYLEKFIFLWRPVSEKSNGIYFSIEKLFLSFCLDIKKYSHINNLSITILELFYQDIIYIIDYLNVLDYEYEYQFFVQALKQNYNKYLNKTKYKNFSNIIEELLPDIFEYTDIYSFVIDYILLFSENYILIDENKSHYPVFQLFKNLFKKILFPDKKYKLNSFQTIAIIEFIIKYSKSVNIQKYDVNIDLAKFNQMFENLLTKINVDITCFFDKNYAYIDFKTILTKENIIFINQLKLF